jgi:hypothetical protein
MKANSIMTHEHTLWVEKFAKKLRLPVWAVALVYNAVFAAVFASIYFLAGAWKLFLTNDGYEMLVLLPFVVVFFLLSVYIRKQMTSLEDYSLSMVKDRELVVEKLSSLSSLLAAIVLGIFLTLFLGIPFIIAKSGQLSLVQGLTTQLVPWFFFTFVVGTTLWVWGYSMIGIYRIGKLPMTLRPFTKDRILGLRPFASTSFRLTAIYYLWISLQVTVDALSFGLSPLIFVRDAALILFGFGLFFLPLINVRKKLLQTKADEMSWIAERYTKVMERIRANGGAPLDESVQRELLSLDKIEKDVRSIRSWPFDTSALAKLLTIVLSVTAILLSKVVASLFRLG